MGGIGDECECAGACPQALGARASSRPSPYTFFPLRARHLCQFYLKNQEASSERGPGGCLWWCGTVRTMVRADSAVERLPGQVEAALEAAVRDQGSAAGEAGSGLRALVRLA